MAGTTTSESLLLKVISVLGDVKDGYGYRFHSLCEEIQNHVSNFKVTRSASAVRLLRAALRRGTKDGRLCRSKVGVYTLSPKMLVSDAQGRRVRYIIHSKNLRHLCNTTAIEWEQKWRSERNVNFLSTVDGVKYVINLTDMIAEVVPHRGSRKFLPISRPPRWPIERIIDVPALSVDLKMPATDDVTLNSVGRDEDTFLQVSQLLHLQGAQIVELLRVVNAPLYAEFQKEVLSMRKSKSVCFAFHGTCFESAMSIAKKGWDTKLIGHANGTALGSGIYFSLNASESHWYTVPTARPEEKYQDQGTALRTIVVAVIAPGDAFDAHSPVAQNVLAPSTTAAPAGYDSVRRNSVYVLFKKQQCFPAFVCVYRCGSSI